MHLKVHRLWVDMWESQIPLVIHRTTTTITYLRFFFVLEESMKRSSL